MTPKELKKHFDQHQKMLVLDVRTAEEYREAHIPNVFHCPLDQLTVERIHDGLKKRGLKDTDLIVITCKAGPRAAKAYEFLKDHFDNIQVLEGCTDAWINCNYEVEQG